MRSRRPAGAKSSRPWAMGHLLHLLLRELQRIIPLGREYATLLVVPRQPTDTRFDQLQATPIAQVLRVFLEMRLQTRGAPNETREILRQREFHAFRCEDLVHAPSGGEPHVWHSEGIPEPDADRGRREAFLVQADDRLLDLAFLHGDPLRVRLEVRAGRAALSFAVRMEAGHRFLGGAAHTARTYLRLTPFARLP